MPTPEKYIFVSYARMDVDAVRPIVRAIQEEFISRALDVRLWVDLEDLRPGQQWEVEIRRALSESIGLLVFFSRAAIESDFVRREVRTAMEREDRPIIVAMLEPVEQLPQELSKIKGLDLSDRTPEGLRESARLIADVTARYLISDRSTPPVSETEAPALAATIADGARGRPIPAAEPAAPDSVFVVYGHSEPVLDEVEAYLTKIGIKAVVLSRMAGPAQSLFQKFLSSSTNARFAIVLLTSDDLGASLIQYQADGVGEKALQFRARQNVILELGFFYGHLGWENVFVVYHQPEKVFPNFERPSDLDGVIFDTIDATGRWRESLSGKLREAGFTINQSQ